MKTKLTNEDVEKSSKKLPHKNWVYSKGFVIYFFKFSENNKIKVNKCQGRLEGSPKQGVCRCQTVSCWFRFVTSQPRYPATRDMEKFSEFLNIILLKWKSKMYIFQKLDQIKKDSNSPNLTWFQWARRKLFNVEIFRAGSKTGSSGEINHSPGGVYQIGF